MFEEEKWGWGKPEQAEHSRTQLWPSAVILNLSTSISPRQKQLWMRGPPGTLPPPG